MEHGTIKCVMHPICRKAKDGSQTHYVIPFSTCTRGITNNVHEQFAVICYVISEKQQMHTTVKNVSFAVSLI